LPGILPALTVSVNRVSPVECHG